MLDTIPLTLVGVGHSVKQCLPLEHDACCCAGRDEAAGAGKQQYVYSLALTASEAASS